MENNKSDKFIPFKELDPKLEFVKLEKQVLDYWKSIDILNYTYSQRKESKEKVFYDGPITANGLPHYGHAITWTMKDIIPRFWTMQNYNVARNMGWDCQGILVEYEVEKKLEFKSKHEVEEYGIEKFNNQCKNSVLEYRKSMLDYEQRLGRLIDHNEEYATMDSKYIESMWWALKELYNKGLLYEGHKVVAYSTRSGMTLSTHEVADGGYSEVIDPAVTIKFKLENQENTYILAWTTTPWTLPSNLLLAVGSKIEYVKVQVENEFYILAKAVLEKVFEEKKYQVIETIKGSDLIGLSYEPIFSNFIDRKEQGAFTIVNGEHVNTEEGSGIVHLAPYGMEDFDILTAKGITLFDYLDEEGVFNDLVPELQGLFYKKANKKIIEILKEKDLLFKYQDYPHQMPIDYRTKTPLIYKPIKSWYVNVEKVKEKLLQKAKEVKFLPESEGRRFVSWIEKARDWSLSRKRFWGTPLPIWINDETNEIKIVGSFKELAELSGQDLQDNFDPHIPYVDQITFKGENGGTFKRVPEVIDVWFDSGSMPYAQHHYPFENKELFNKRYPADFISEGDDQVRLWFYTMFVLGVSLFDEVPYKNVVVIGMLGDEKGKKMSKSKGNYPPMDEVFTKYGSDMFRFFLLTSPTVQGEASKFSYNLLLETKKEYFTMLWNSYRYFITYANSNKYVPTLDKPEPQEPLNKWILARLKETTIDYIDNLNEYKIIKATRLLRPFVNDLSTWYIRRSRDQIRDGNKEYLDTLYYVLVEFTKLMSPVTPLLAEHLYQSLNAGNITNLKSVSTDVFTKYQDITQEEKQILNIMQVSRQIVSMALSLRTTSEVKIRQPLNTLYIQSSNNIDENQIDDKVILDELNIKNIVFDKPNTDFISLKNDEFTIWLDTNITDDLKYEGIAREIVRTIQSLRKKGGLKVEDKVKVTYKNTPENIIAVEKHQDEITSKGNTVSLQPGDEFLVEKV